LTLSIKPKRFEEVTLLSGIYSTDQQYIAKAFGADNSLK
jgi:hypothetical protein